MKKNERLSPKRIILLVICAAIAALFLLTWVEAKAEIMGRESFSLWNVSSFVKALPDLNQWMGFMDAKRAELWETGICVGFYVLLAFLCFQLIQSVWSLCSMERRIRRGGFIFPALFSGCAIAAPYVLDRYFGLSISGAIRLSVIPYVMLGAGLIGFFLSLILTENDEDQCSEPSVPENKTEAPAAAPAVIKEKSEAGLNVPYKTVGKVRVFPVCYYDPRANLRPVTARLDWARAMLQISLFSYSTLSITAARVDVEMVTAFKETVKVERLSYTELLQRSDSHGREYVSEFAKLNVDPDTLRQVHEIRVYLRTVVCDGKPYNIPANVSYKKSGVKAEELPALRSAHGKDVMERSESLSQGWVCWCGRENGYFDLRCHMCGRSNVQKGESSGGEAAFCGKCGAKLETGAAFCYSCGAPQQPGKG